MQLADFKGGELSAVVPLGQELLNRVAQQVMAHPDLQHLYLHCRDNNRIRVELTIKKGLTITKDLLVRVEENLHFPDHPRLHMEIEDGLNFLDRILIGFLKNSTPDFVILSGRSLTIELAPALALAGMAEHIPRIRSARVQVEAERAILHAGYHI